MDGFGYRFLVAKSRFPVGSAVFHCHLIGQLAAKYIFCRKRWIRCPSLWILCHAALPGGNALWCHQKKKWERPPLRYSTYSSFSIACSKKNVQNFPRKKAQPFTESSAFAWQDGCFFPRSDCFYNPNSCFFLKANSSSVRIPSSTNTFSSRSSAMTCAVVFTVGCGGSIACSRGKLVR